MKNTKGLSKMCHSKMLIQSRLNRSLADVAGLKGLWLTELKGSWLNKHQVVLTKTSEMELEGKPKGGMKQAWKS